MPVSIPGMYKVAIETALPELTGKIWRREHLPDEVPLPYVTIFDGIADTPVLHGDARGLGWMRLVQVDVWQESLLATDLLVARVINVVDGLAMQQGPFGFMTSSVQSTTKVPDEEPGIDHVAITCQIPHAAFDESMTPLLMYADSPEQLGLRRLASVPPLDPEDI